MYSIEQLEKIWITEKPLYFKIVEGKKSNGAGRGTFFYEPAKGETIAKGEGIAPDVRAKESEDLWKQLIERVDILNDGYYTIVLQASKSASATASPYTIAKGDVSQMIGSTGTQTATSEWGSNRNGGGGNNDMIMLMMQMMQQQNNSMMQLQQQNNAQMIQMLGQSNVKDMELYKAKQKKGFDDKIFGLLEKPHVVGAAMKMMDFSKQASSVGRAEAPEGATVPPIPRPQRGEGDSPQPQRGEGDSPRPQRGEGDSPQPQRGEGDSPQPQRGEGPNPEDVLKLQTLLRDIQAEYPDENPIDVLSNGYNSVKAFLKGQQNPQDDE